MFQKRATERAIIFNDSLKHNLWQEIVIYTLHVQLDNFCHAYLLIVISLINFNLRKSAKVYLQLYGIILMYYLTTKICKSVFLNWKQMKNQVVYIIISYLTKSWRFPQLQILLYQELLFEKIIFYTLHWKLDKICCASLKFCCTDKHFDNIQNPLKNFVKV